jgi:hypothetical protein
VHHDKTSWTDCTTGRFRDRVNRKLAGLRRYTAGVTTCAWPDCDKSTPEDFAANRIGVLCVDHAWSHYDAMNAYLTWPPEDTLAAAALRAREVALDEPTTEEIEAKRQGHVYYLRVGEQIKIGFSADVKRRLRAYPPGSELLAVEPGTKTLELGRHRQFVECLDAGREWFRPEAKLLEHIASVHAQHGSTRRFEHSYQEPRRPQDTTQALRLERSSARVI